MLTQIHFHLALLLKTAFVPGAFLLLFVMMDLFKIAVALEFSLTSESVQSNAICSNYNWTLFIYSVQTTPHYKEK